MSKGRWAAVIVAVWMLAVCAIACAGQTASRDGHGMGEGWAAFLGVVVGSIVSSGALMLDGYLRHLRLRRERLQDFLVEKRVEAYAQIMQRLFLLRERLLPSAARDLEYLRDLRTEIDALPKVLDHQRLVIAPKVHVAFEEAYAEFKLWWSRRMEFGDPQFDDQYPGGGESMDNAFGALYNATARAIGEDMNVRGFAVASPDDLTAAQKRGRDRAEATAKRRVRPETKGG